MRPISSKRTLHLKSPGFPLYKVGHFGHISSIFLTTLVFFMLFGGTFVGKIFDDYGPRYLLLVGTFLHVFGLMMTSLSTQYYQLLLSQAICSPIGASMVFYPAFTCVSSS